jgi:hypothetical protein
VSTDDRVKRALDFAVRYGGIDGAHHKLWVIDQMVRALTGCPMVDKTAKNASGREYSYQTQGESEEYKKLVAEACAGEEGPATYAWDEGSPP